MKKKAHKYLKFLEKYLNYEYFNFTFFQEKNLQNGKFWLKNTNRKKRLILN